MLSPATVVLMGLEPNTTYEVRVAAVNGKGQGEFSHTEAFQTLPIRKLLITSLLINVLTVNNVDADKQQLEKPQTKHLYLDLY